MSNQLLPITRKNLFLEWDTAGNGGRSLGSYSKGSHELVCWICSKCGEPFKARISDRAKDKGATGCPFCSGRKPRIGKNDLATLYPDLMRQWDFDKNVGIDPKKLTRGCKKEVFWLCDREGCGYSWKAPVYTRTKVRKPSSCPACSGRVAIPGKNDLATVRPDLIEEWDFRKNVGINPSEVAFSSHRKVYWICREYHHSYDARVYNRTGKNPTGCPYCGHRKILPGFNDLATIYPDAAERWIVKKNDNVEAKYVMPFSNSKGWFLCRHGHPVYVKICDYVIGNCSCSVCESLKKK